MTKEREIAPLDESGVMLTSQLELVPRLSKKAVEMPRPDPAPQSMASQRVPLLLLNPYLAPTPEVPPAPSILPASESSVAPQSPQRGEGKKRKRHRGLIAAIVILVLLAALAAGAFFMWKAGTLDALIQTFTGAPSEGQPVRRPYASTEPVLVACDTGIVPLRVGDEPPSSYRVRLKEADDFFGKDHRHRWLPAPHGRRP